MAKHDFLSLKHCLDLGHSVGVLATAIETVGIFTWDRYGRFMAFDKTSVEAADALDVLARFLAFLESPWDDDEPDLDDPDSVLSLCGWPRHQLPDLAEDQSSPQRPRSTPAMTKTESSSLPIIGALLLFIRGTGGIGKHPDFKSETKLIDWMTQVVGGYAGLSKRNLEGKFAAAKKVLDNP
jgi:hypothetical protein